MDMNANIWTHVRARIDLRALADNFRLIRNVASNPVPVIKSDAYGHGMPEVAQALFAAGARTMAVGTVGDGVFLKERLPEADSLSLLGPLDEADYRSACERNLLVVAGNEEQLLRLEETAKRCGTAARVALKFETGMGRLGFAPEEAEQLAETLRGLRHIRVGLICSHLSSAELPGQIEYTREQSRRFDWIMRILSGRGIVAPGSLANSGAVLAHPELHYAWQRPGISLYGGNPFHGTDWEEKGRGFRQVMEVSTRLLEVRTLRAGQAVSYGATYVASGDIRVGIVGTGYADNYPRGLSGKGWMLLHGRRVPVLGRVCMQMTAVDLSHVPEARVGDRVFLLGGGGPEHISADEMADWWGSVSYEVFCLLGKNPREYVR